MATMPINPLWTHEERQKKIGCDSAKRPERECDCTTLITLHAYRTAPLLALHFADIPCLTPATRGTSCARCCKIVSFSRYVFLLKSLNIIVPVSTRVLLVVPSRGALVIVDELGRGTSTCDGFGIAWAVADRLVSSGTCNPDH